MRDVKMKYLMMSRKVTKNNENVNYVNKLPDAVVKGGGFFMKKKLN